MKPHPEGNARVAGEPHGIGRHDECACGTAVPCIHRGLSVAGTAVRDKRNQRVCRGYPRSRRN